MKAVTIFLTLYIHFRLHYGTRLSKRANFPSLDTNPWPHPHYRVYRRFLVVEENTRAWWKLGILKDHSSFAAHSTHRMILRLYTSGSLRCPVPEISYHITGHVSKSWTKCCVRYTALILTQDWWFLWGWNL